MKYKRHIATGALALSLLVGGSSALATTSNTGTKTSPTMLSRPKNVKLKKQYNTVGSVESISDTGFIVDVTNMKTKAVSSVDITTNSSTVYSKDGVIGTVSDLAVGQKVIVVGPLDKTTNTVTAGKVKIITKFAMAPKMAKKVKTVQPKTN